MTERGGSAASIERQAELVQVFSGFLEQTHAGAEWRQRWLMWGVPVAQDGKRFIVRSRTDRGEDWVSTFDARGTLLDVRRAGAKR